MLTSCEYKQKQVHWKGTIIQSETFQEYMIACHGGRLQLALTHSGFGFCDPCTQYEPTKGAPNIYRFKIEENPLLAISKYEKEWEQSFTLVEAKVTTMKERSKKVKAKLEAKAMRDQN